MKSTAPRKERERFSFNTFRTLDGDSTFLHLSPPRQTSVHTYCQTCLNEQRFFVRGRLLKAGGIGIVFVAEFSNVIPADYRILRTLRFAPFLCYSRLYQSLSSEECQGDHLSWIVAGRMHGGVKRPIGFTSIWVSYLTGILVAKVGCFDNRLGVQTSNFCYRKSGGVKRPIGDMSRRPFSWIVARRMHGGVKRPRFYLHLGILPHQYFGGKSCMSGRPHERPDVQLLPLHW